MRHPIENELARLADPTSRVPGDDDAFRAKVNRRMAEYRKVTRMQGQIPDAQTETRWRDEIERTLRSPSRNIGQSIWRTYTDDVAADFVRIAKLRDVRPRRLFAQEVRNIPSWRLPGFAGRPYTEAVSCETEHLAWSVIPGVLIAASADLRGQTSERLGFLTPRFETVGSGGSTVLHVLVGYERTVPDRDVAVASPADRATRRVPLETLLAEYLLGGGYHEFQDEGAIDGPMLCP